MNREVICANSLPWMAEQIKCGVKWRAIITSLPDMDEVVLKQTRYKLHALTYFGWLERAARLLALLTADDGCCIFYQTDRRTAGVLLDKVYTISLEFYTEGYKKVFHKIALRQAVGTVSLYRPAFSHLFCFSKTLKAGQATVDVLAPGTRLYANGMTFSAVEIALDYIKRKVKTQIVLDPFCGRGTVLGIANAYGLDAVGIDIDPVCCTAARELALNAELFEPLGDGSNAPLDNCAR